MLKNEKSDTEHVTFCLFFDRAAIFVGPPPPDELEQ